uniref:60S ribosomal protein L13 n=1 Tax=Noctiluca scintillans TaxID=2966 RepID=A0A7S1A9J2_NOCSC|mmetsp:Transcript_37344/g.99300  ORF Transcript_37344/g.99300 Transcript_37344/m.99300 type:complete len:214 (+) Transcript_37344:60-701(+)
MGHGGNNVIPNVHFRKVNGMQKGGKNRDYIKPWLDQAGRKKSRRVARQKKVAAIFPRPAAGLLRPLVHCPTQRYNMKIRLGRGFTLEELRAAKVSPKKALTIGIALDHRRRNRCVESRELNVNRLKVYLSKLMIFPRRSKVKSGDTARSELENVAQNTLKDVIPRDLGDDAPKAQAITADMKKLEAYKTIRRAFVTKKNYGKKLKREAESKKE